MRQLLLAVLLITPAAASAKKAPSAAKAKVAVSTAAAGSDLIAYAPSTAPITLDLISARFAEVDARIKTLSADFKQFVRLEGSDTVQQVEGDVLFKKPDLMRLNHSLPEKQTVVSDGTFLWVYRPSTNQVIQTRLEAWRRKEPLAKGLLDFGKSADLLKRYTASISTVSAPGPGGWRIFSVNLSPKPEEHASGDADFTLTLTANTKDFFPYEAALRVGRASVRSTFDNVRLNPELPAETFHFSPPTGADVFATPDQP